MTVTLSNYFKPSNAPIFPNSVLDIDKQIVTYISDPTVLVALSGVNKAAYQTLSNSEFFKNLFLRLHSYLAKQKQTFRTFCKYHPNNCWKVACIALLKGVFKPEAHFIKDAISIKCQLLELKKAQSEEQLKALCGLEHVDSNSPFAQARKAYVLAKREYEQAVSKQEEYFLPLRLVHTHEELCGMAKMLSCCDTTEVFKDRTDEEIRNLSQDELGVFKRDFIPSYRSLFNYFQKVRGKFQELKKLCKTYQDLETQRSLYKEKIKCANLKLLELKFSPSDFLQKHRTRLHIAFKRESIIEKEHISVLILRECLSLIDVCLKQDSPSSNILACIRALINSLDHNLKTQIWLSLYQAFANGVIEDQWAENHFAEFLPGLYELIKGIEDYRDFLANSDHFFPAIAELPTSFTYTVTLLGRPVTIFFDKDDRENHSCFGSL